MCSDKAFDNRHLMKIDIDNKDADVMSSMFNRLMILKKHFALFDLESHTTETLKGFHVRIWFRSHNKIDDKDLVFFQWVLGSDVMREVFNWVRVRQGWEHWNALFNDKYILKEDKMEWVSGEREIDCRGNCDKTSQRDCKKKTDDL